MSFRSTAHVAHLENATALVARALRTPRRTVVRIGDELSYGPLLGLDDRARFWSARANFWRSFGVPPERFIARESRLRSARRIVLWIGTVLGDQLLLAWMPSYLRSLDIDPDRLRVVQVRELSLSLASRRAVLAAPQPAWLRQAELRYLDEAWHAVSASDPIPLLRFLDQTNPHLPCLRPALRQLVDRYPGIHTRLSVPEEMLLASVRDHGPSVPRIIGHTMIQSYDAGFPLADGWLFSHLRRLASVASPAVVLSGDAASMRGTEATLTEMGQEILAGRAPFAKRNTIDEWIAGVHLDSREGRVWLRTGPFGLVPDPARPGE
jgi:hypothetical protein